ncbi:hypothetical protein QO206_13330 [Leeuwenhoekiella aequorea]|uniref:hypothetical protein n=1 Tax=Leeuwenhoekiella aequorea TaxID=283736 RepID=UPI00352DFEC8|tara:strand:+ start:26189 stop:28297 length:2109 start_codon:yes stop_codon:yes gene_type:complete
MLDNRNRIIFESTLGKREFIHDPVGWDELDTTVGRSNTTHGIFTTISQNLEFVFEAREYLVDLYLLEGVQAKCKMTRQKRDSFNDNWKTIDDGDLDFSQFKWNKESCTLDFIENGFSEKFDNYKKEEFEIDRLDDIDGNILKPLAKQDLVISGRRIFLKSALYVEDGAIADFDNLSNRNNYESRVIPLNIDYKSDENIVIPTSRDFSESNQNYGDGFAGNMFYLNADRDRTIVLNGTISGRHVGATSTEFFRFSLIRYKKDSEGVYKRLEVINLVTKNTPNTSISYTFNNYVINVEEGESYALGASIFSGGRSTIVFNSSRIEITEDSAFRETSNKAIKAFDLGQRLTHIIDVNAEFKSDLLQNEFSGLLFASGATIRNVKIEDESGNESIAPLLTTSFEDFYDAINVITPIAYDVYKESGKNIVRIESIDYFFNPKPFVKVGRVADIENEIDPDWVYSAIDIGYENSGDIEGVYGLRATHTVNSYTLPIDRVDNVYEVVTEYRTDPNEIEDCRRIQFEDYPERDTKYDKDVFIIDAEILIGKWNVRRNQRDFLEVKGVFSPETTFNNRLSPANCLLRHAKVFKSGMQLDYFNNKKLRYASTTGQNNKLITTSLSGVETPEELTRDISEFSKALFTPVRVTFTGTLEEDIYAGVKRNGRTDDSPNKFKLIEYIDYSGVIQQGYIYKLDFNNEIKYELRWLQD